MLQITLMAMILIDPLHNGARRGLGLIDRPIYRERSTGYPVIQASTIKGKLRDLFSLRAADAVGKQKILATFGPEPGAGDSHSGAISFGEGQLLAMPISILNGDYVWATTKLILHRLQQKLRLAGVRFGKLPELLGTQPSGIPIVTPAFAEQFLLPPVQGISNTGILLLEEMEYLEVAQSAILAQFARSAAEHVFGPASYLCSRFAEKLIILPEDAFRHFVMQSTELAPNIRIGENGVTEDGSLRYTEYVPRDAVFFCFISYEAAKKPGKTVPPYNYNVVELGLEKSLFVQRFFESKLDRIHFIQIGGDETTGKGLVELRKIP